MVSVALHSGIRLGEILNLRWYDLDFSSGFILVRDSKNGESRHVPMDATLFALFRAYPHRPSTDLVFSSSSGGHIVDVRTGFQNACKRAGLIDLHFHDLRHTFAKTGRATTIPYADVERVQGVGLSKGAKIGIIVGAAVVTVAVVIAVGVCRAGYC